MNWEILIVPLIALGVWILSTVFKNETDVAKHHQPGSPAGRPPAQPGR